jgi:hypothetical protein
MWLKTSPDRVLGRMLTIQVKKSAGITAKGFHPAPSVWI